MATVFSSTHNAGDSTLNTLHLELLYHWSRGLYKCFVAASDCSDQMYSDTCIKHGLRYSFLMRQILATSALHLSILRQDQRAFYHQHATQLQSEALAGYNAILQDLNESNIVAAFLVSSLIGMHVFCDTFLIREEAQHSFNNTIDSLIGSINLLRGIRHIMRNWWTFLCKSELSDMLLSASKKWKAYVEVPVALADLNRMVDTADVGTSTKETYKQAVRELETVFAAQADRADPEASTSVNMIFSWLVLVPKEYVELLSARRPEALIILSYYAVNLHYRKGFWAINDAGSFLIEGISSHLGTRWDQWLAWPRQIASA